jgi:hypothetical protein
MWLPFFAKLFRRPSVNEVVDCAFRQDDREFAKSFYEMRKSKKYITVALGDGCHGLDKDSFFESAFFHFILPPVRMRSGKDWAIGTDAEDEMGTVVVNEDTGGIDYVYEGLHVPLADSFREFIASLRAAGWQDNDST